ncbi:hypothetical protein V5799_005596 [Amblyomma americanum]|uniref:Uncharacterized protein n=1 Tax=Amblyomma americanum TaxID=6943 RepID=A0AAQ4DYU1_AMBAM
MSDKDRSRHPSGGKDPDPKKSEESTPTRATELTPRRRRSTSETPPRQPPSPAEPTSSPKSPSGGSKLSIKRLSLFRKSGSYKSVPTEGSPKKQPRPSSTPPKKETSSVQESSFSIPPSTSTSASTSGAEPEPGPSTSGSSGAGPSKRPLSSYSRKELDALAAYINLHAYPQRVQGKEEYLGLDQGNYLLFYPYNVAPPKQPPSKQPVKKTPPKTSQSKTTPPKTLDLPKTTQPKTTPPKSTLDPDDGAVPSTSGTSEYETYQMHYGRPLVVTLPPESPPPPSQPPAPEETEEERMRRPRRKGEPRRP